MKLGDRVRVTVVQEGVVAENEERVWVLRLDSGNRVLLPRGANNVTIEKL